MVALLAQWETIKKDKNSKHCHDQQKKNSPFFLSVNIILETEALVVIAQIKLNHGSKNGRTYFSCTGLDKRPKRNCGCEIVLTYYPRSSTPHYPAGKGDGLGPVIGN